MLSTVGVGHVAVTEEIPRARFASLLAGSWWKAAVLVVVASTAIGVVFALPMLNMDLGWKQSLAQWWAWGLITPVILLVDRHLPFTGRQPGRRAAAHGAVSVVFTAIYIYLFFALRDAIGDKTLPGGPHLGLLKPVTMLKNGSGWFVWSCLIYWLIVGGLQAYRY